MCIIINSVNYDLHTFCYSTLGIQGLYPETVPPGVQPLGELQEVCPTLIGASDISVLFVLQGSPMMNHSDWCQLQTFFQLL